MLQKLQELIQDAQVRQALAAAKTQADAVDVLRVAAAKKGYKLSADGVAQALTTLMPEKTQEELNEDELLAVSGGLRCNTSGGFPPPPITMNNPINGAC